MWLLAASERRRDIKTRRGAGLSPAGALKYQNPCIYLIIHSFCRCASAFAFIAS